MIIALCLFFSGAAALVLQVLWTRMLGLAFGATALAVSTVLTAFMGGLAVGAHLGGRVAARLKQPLLAFAALEAAVGIYGLCVPALFALLPAAAGWLPPTSGSGPLGLAGAALPRFALALVVLAAPTAAMGATLPILAEAAARGRTGVASVVGRLYAANTAGAVAGALAAGFLLLPWLGLAGSVRAAAAIDLLVAIAVAALALRRRQFAAPDPALPARAPFWTAPQGTARTTRAVLVAFAVSGAAAMALEVLWTRAITVVIGSSSYALALVLATFLAGLAAGSALVTAVVDRLVDPVRWLAWAEVAAGGCAAAGSLFLDRLPSLLLAAVRSGEVLPSTVHLANLAIAALVMLPATLALGAVFPLVVRALAPGVGVAVAHAGPLVGRAYAANTAGAVAGSFAGGFLLLPGLGVRRGLAACALASIATGAVLALATAPRSRRPVRLLAAALAAAALVLAAPGWDLAAWTAGIFRFQFRPGHYPPDWAPGGELLFHRDGLAATVTVEGQADSQARWLKINGKVDASDGGDMPTQLLLGLLPALVAPRAERVLIVGYGSGVSAGAALATPVRRLDVVEIEPAVVEAADRFFAHVNRRPATDPRFRLHIDDGRSFLASARGEPWDVIVSEPSNPWLAGSASLFTLDFFAIARRHLAAGGVFVQWLQLYELSRENVASVLRTFQAVFPEVLVLTPPTSPHDALLVGAASGLQVDRRRLEALLAHQRVRPLLAQAGIEAPEDLLGLLTLDSAAVRATAAATAVLNTDDNARIELGAPRDLILQALVAPSGDLRRQADGRRLALARPHLTGWALDDPAWRAAAARRFLLQGLPADAAAAARGIAALSLLAASARRLATPEPLPAPIDSQAATADPGYRQVAELARSGNTAAALAAAGGDDGFASRGLAHALLHAWLLHRHDRPTEASLVLSPVIADRAFAIAHPPALDLAARIQFRRRLYRQAAEYMEAYVTLTGTAP